MTTEGTDPCPPRYTLEPLTDEETEAVLESIRENNRKARARYLRRYGNVHKAWKDRTS